MKTTILILSALLHFTSYSQIPDSIRFDWSVSGEERSMKSAKTINIADNNSLNYGLPDYSVLLQSIIDSHHSDSQLIVHFPAGVYKFTKTIYLKSGITIEGEGANKTKFTFNNGSVGHLFLISASQCNSFFGINKALYKHAESLEVFDANTILPGNYYELLVDGSGLATSDWAMSSIGQIFKINSIANKKAGLSTKLKLDYYKYNNPRLRLINPINDVHFRFFSIERNDKSSAQTSNFYFHYAVNCTVIGVESNMCNMSHITFSKSYRCRVADCYFHHAFDYGGGGKAYGIELSNSSSNCLVENTIFENLRHSILLQSGANGNVISGNYSLNPFWKEGLFPANSAGELVLHGNYPFANLFEGNQLGNIVVDNSHGLNGPGNVFYRNRASTWGLLMNANAGNSTCFIGNEITGTLKVFTGSGNINYANYFCESDTNLIKTMQIPKSLFQLAKPCWWPVQSQFPVIGLPVGKLQADIPAKYRFAHDSLRALNSSPNIFIVRLSYKYKEINGRLNVELESNLQVNVQSLKLEKMENNEKQWSPLTTDVSNRFLFQKNISEENIVIPKENTCYRWKACGINNQVWVSETFCTSAQKLSSENNKMPVYSVYPNPTSHSININLSDPSLVKIYNTTGTMLIAENFSTGIANLDLLNLTPASYVVEIDNGKNISRQLVLKIQ